MFCLQTKIVQSVCYENYFDRIPISGLDSHGSFSFYKKPAVLVVDYLILKLYLGAGFIVLFRFIGEFRRKNDSLVFIAKIEQNLPQQKIKIYRKRQKVCFISDHKYFTNIVSRSLSLINFISKNILLNCAKTLGVLF